MFGLIAGIAVGCVFHFMGGQSSEPLVRWIFTFLDFVGKLFIRLIQMCVVPLVFFSIADGVASLDDVTRLRSIGIKTFIYIIATGVISAGIGIALGVFFAPGSGVFLEGNTAAAATDLGRQEPSVYDTLLGFFAANPFIAMASADMMPVITFSIFCGCAMIVAGDKGRAAKEAFSNMASVIGHVVNIVLKMTPYGTFALISVTIGKYGTLLAGPMLKFLALDWAGQIIIQVVIFNFILVVIARLNPIKFWKRAVEPWIITFTTGSSNAALPVNLKLASEMGIPSEISTFVLPIGATANMNGICCFIGLIAVFAAQIHGIELTMGGLAYIAMQCVILAIGCAAVPAGGIIMSTTLFTTLGFPMETIGIVAGAYKIVDGIHTTSNSVGDLVISAAVARNEGSMNKAMFENA